MTDQAGKMNTRQRTDSSISGCIAASFFLRSASSATGILTGLYLSFIDVHVHPVSAKAVGMVATSFYAVELIFSPALGAVGDLLGWKALISFGPLAGVLASQIFPASTVLLVLLVAAALQGLSNAACIPSMLGLLSDVTSGSAGLRGKAMSLFQITAVLGMILGFLAAGILWDTFGPSGFRIVSLLYLASAAIAFAKIGKVKAGVSGSFHKLKHYHQLLRNTRVFHFFPVCVVMSAIAGLWLAHTAFQMSGDRGDSAQLLMTGFSGGQIGITLAMVLFILVAGMYLGGIAAAKFRKTTAMLIALSGVYAFGPLLYAINHSDVASRSPKGVVIVPLAILLGVAIFVAGGFVPAALSYLADLSECYIKERGTIMGVYAVSLWGGQLLGSWVGGVFADLRGIDGMIALTMVLAVVGTIATLGTRRFEEQRGHFRSR